MNTIIITIEEQKKLLKMFTQFNNIFKKLENVPTLSKTFLDNELKKII